MDNSDLVGMMTFIKPHIQFSTQLPQWVNRGLILRSQKSEAVVKCSVLTVSERLFAAKYLPYFSTELKYKLEQDRLKIQAKLMSGESDKCDRDQVSYKDLFTHAFLLCFQNLKKDRLSANVKA